jgi:hypothetical protein
MLLDLVDSKARLDLLFFGQLWAGWLPDLSDCMLWFHFLDYLVVPSPVDWI